MEPALAQAEPSLIPPPIWNSRRLFALLGPLLIEQLLVITMGIADTIMVASVGEFAVSGVSLVDTLNILLITAFAALATGGTVVVSQYIGRQDAKNACHSARQLVYISVIISLVIMVLSLFFCTPILRLAYGDISPDVMEAARTYFLITALSFPFLALYNASAALFRSMGNSGVTMRIALLVNIISIGGNALFIFGFGWGVAGAALATLIARFLAAFVLTWLLLYRPGGVVNLKGLSKISFDWQMIRRILNIGIPSGLESSMFQFGKILIARIFTAFGTVAIAANAIAMQINSIGFMTGMAFGIGLLTIVGQCIGAGDYAGAKYYTALLVKFTYLLYFVINVFIWIFMDSMLSIFGLSPETHAMAKDFLRIHCISSSLLWPLSFVLPNALKAAGDARYVMIIASVTMWVVRVITAYLLAFSLGMGPSGVYIAMCGDFLFRAIFFSARWLKGTWMKKKVI